MTSIFPLDTLPIEIQCSIIRVLNPIALISLSQTSTHFRNIINPTKAHHIERLLALECLSEFGGPQIHFSRLGIPTPDRNSPEWEANRWACTGCLQLLPQQAFTNQALSRLRYRKPLPGSPATRRYTSWEPTSLASRRGSRSLKDHQISRHSEERQLRRRYASATTESLGGGLATLGRQTDLWTRLNEIEDSELAEFEATSYTGVQGMSDGREGEIFDRDAYAVEFLRAGSNRHVRRCIECRFRRGEFRGCAGRARGTIGTVNVPIVVGRKKSFDTVVDRYFPGLSDMMESQRPVDNAPVFVVYREDALDLPWTMYRVRCPGCAQWKELRAFRVGGLWPRWKPVDNGGTHDQYGDWDDTDITEESLDGMRCNHCFLKSNGRDALGAKLVEWLEFLVTHELQQMAQNLVRGLEHLFRWSGSAPKKEKRQIKALVYDIRSLFGQQVPDLTYADVASLRHLWGKWMARGKVAPRWVHADKWFMDCVNYYDESEAMWFWLKRFKQEIREPGKGGILVDWVLNRDETVTS
ncbi:hypothetical protein BJX76DRAFT_287131 [Aspergillus varians]